MSRRRIDFADLDWEIPLPGARFKRHAGDGRVVRLIEFTEDLVEPDWCRKGHVGYVVDGRLTIDFPDGPVVYETGDALLIEAHEADRHMARVGPGERALLFMVEEE